MVIIMKQLLTIFVLLALSGCTALKQTAFSDEEGAIRGYDPVAYFTESKPVKGKRDISHSHRGVVWYFASEDNLQRFKNQPEKYAPQYGGYCAYAMSRGFVVSIDPEAWSIQDDKLYLNYSLGVRKTWLKDPVGYIEKADSNWQEKLDNNDLVYP